MKNLHLTYKEWLSHANVTDNYTGPDQDHWYFRLIACGTMKNCEEKKISSDYLYDELPFFQPYESNYPFIIDPVQQMGIHCRFGMQGVIAENHFDVPRNAIVMLGGERRYILAHPYQCKNLALYPKNHPSGRHSMVDWSNPDLGTFPEFGNTRVNEVVLQAGDVLYLPSNWFHHIVSLGLNWQCNTRSGVTTKYLKVMEKCGFAYDVKVGNGTY